MQQIPPGSVHLALNVLNNRSIYDQETRKSTTQFLKIVVQLKNSTRLTPTEEIKIWNENDLLESDAGVAIFMKNILEEVDAIETSKHACNLVQNILSIFYSWVSSLFD